MDSLLKDIRYAFRTLFRNPAFAAIAALTIALGIGANTAIFSVVRAVLLRPLPYPDSERLVLVWSEMTSRNVPKFPFSPPVLRELQQRNTVFEGLAGVFTFQQALTGGVGDPQQIMTAAATPNFLEVLEVEPVMGRDFTADDAVFTEPAPGFAGASLPSAVLLSHELWRTRFGGDPGVVGRTIEMGGAAIEVVGVMPEGFKLHMPPGSGIATEVDAWLPPAFDLENWNWANAAYTVVGRLRPGVTLERAEAEMDRLAAWVRDQVPIFETAGFAINLIPMRSDLTAGVRPVILALLGAVGFVLLIACANVSNLLLVRATTREREMAIRAALGGERGQLLRQLLTESVVLALVGGVVGLALAVGGIELLLELRPRNLPRIDSVGIDGSVLAFTFAAALVAALVFGIIPAVQASRPQMVESLRERGGPSGLSRQRLLRNGVVVLEVALSVVLLIGAGLLLRSFVELQRVDPGYEPEGLLTFGLSLPITRYPTTEARYTFMTQLRERLQTVPGVSSASAIFPLPLSGPPFNGRYGTEEALGDESQYRQAAYRIVLPGYFETMGTRLLAGRTFTRADNADSASVAVVDELLAQRTWPGESPIGKRFLVRLFSDEPVFVEVIGVVEHQRAEDLAADGRETVFFVDRWAGGFGALTWAVRSEVPAQRLVPLVRNEVAALDPQLPLADVRPMQSIVSDAMGGTRFAFVLIGVFGVTALVLAAVGLYGVLAYVVRQRTAEIGVRMAFGAEPGSILRLVLNQGLLLTLIGLVVGVVAALGLTRFMASLLVGVRPTDPVTYGAITLVFIAIAAIATLVPAWRATRVDPVVALRQEG